MFFLYLGIFLLVIGIIGFKYGSYKLEDPSLCAGFLGGITILISLIMWLLCYQINRELVVAYNYNPCSKYHINDEIAQHREFENDFLVGIAYSHKVANLPYVVCVDDTLSRTIPRW